MNKTILLLFLVGFMGFAQQTPVEYMDQISQGNDEILKQTWTYLKAISKGQKPRRIEKKRAKVEKSIREAINRVRAAGAYNGNRELKDSALSVLNFHLDVMTGRAKKLVDMEEVAYQSYDFLEAYVLYQRQINEKVAIRNEFYKYAQHKFASEHNVNLTEATSELGEKVKESSKILQYREMMYLSMMRGMMKEAEVLKGLGNPETASNYDGSEGLMVELLKDIRQKMDTISAPNADLSLRKATESALSFLEKEAKELYPKIVEFNEKQAEFEAFKKEFESDKNNEFDRNKVNEFNQKVNEINRLSKQLNNLYSRYNLFRESVQNQWNNVSTTFLDRHVPD